MRAIQWGMLGCLGILLAGGCSEDETPTIPDTTPPAAITDLTVQAVTATAVTLAWTASGDDSLSGTAAAYDLRFRESPFTIAAWDSLRQATGEPDPQPAGTPESFTVTGLSPERDYFFALRVDDEAGNHSALSAILPATTLRMARSWRIEPQGGGDFTAISDALAAAGDGDTLLIAAGVYDEALSIGGRRLVLSGAGAGLTRIVHASDHPGELLVFAADADLLVEEIGFQVLSPAQPVGYLNGFVVDDSRITIRGCALIECGLTVAASELTLSGCTLYRNPPTQSGELVPLVWVLYSTASVARNIIASSDHYGVACADAEITFVCNDCFEHAAGNYSGCPDPTGTHGNISENPRFVDPAAGDFRLQPDSPCIDESTECGRMGAFGVAE